MPYGISKQARYAARSRSRSDSSSASAVGTIRLGGDTGRLRSTNDDRENLTTAIWNGLRTGTDAEHPTFEDVPCHDA